MSFSQPVIPQQQKTRPPPGWVPPFAGAPPPVPPGVNPQVWGAGAWHFNSAYLYAQTGQPPPQNNSGWVPGYGWPGSQQQQQQQQFQQQQQQQQQAMYNPYKRVPRPPSAEYMASSLSANPLGLTNMIPREELYGDDGTPQTPWIWNPPGLISTEADQGVITAAFTDEHGHRIAQEVRGPTPSRQSSLDRTEPPLPQLPPPPPYSQVITHRSPTPSRRSSYDRANGSTIYANMPPYPDLPPLPPSRQGSHEQPNDISPSRHSAVRRDSAPSSRQNSQDRLNDVPSAQNANSRSNSGSSSSSGSGIIGVLPTLDRPLGRPKDPSSVYQQRFVSPGIPDLSSPRQSPSRAGHAPERHGHSHRQISPRRDRPEDQSFTAKMDLQPTFSPNIVRIPDHYHSPTRRGSSGYEDDSNRSSSSSSHPPSASSSSSSSNSHPLAQLISHMDQLNTGTSSNSNNNTSHNQLVRQSSLPTYIYGPPLSANNHISDTAEEALSPLMYGNALKQGSRAVLRGFSVPDIRGTTLNTIPETSSSSVSSSSTPAPSHNVPYLHHHHHHHHHPRSLQTSPASSSSGGDHPTPPPPPPASAGLPPRPPAEVVIPPPPLSASAITTTTRAPTMPPTQRVRVGFWNRRGDHLTRTMHIVYAPPERAYPKELETYPEKGYRDHLGIELPYDPNRPELLESLPRHGRPPVAPYDSFVVYA